VAILAEYDLTAADILPTFPAYFPDLDLAPGLRYVAG
jgi:hypothetical protein